MLQETLGPHVVPGAASKPVEAAACGRDGDGVHSSPAVASIAAALRDRLQLDGSPACKTQEQIFGINATEELSPVQQLLRVCNQSVSQAGDGVALYWKWIFDCFLTPQ